MNKASFKVYLPEFIRLNSGEVVSFFIGPGGDAVTLDYNGNVTVKGNGGGTPIFSINILDLLNNIKNSVVEITDR